MTIMWKLGETHSQIVIFWSSQIVAIWVEWWGVACACVCVWLLFWLWFILVFKGLLLLLLSSCSLFFFSFSDTVIILVFLNCFFSCLLWMWVYLSYLTNFCQQESLLEFLFDYICLIVSTVIRSVSACVFFWLFFDFGFCNIFFIVGKSYLQYICTFFTFSMHHYFRKLRLLVRVFVCIFKDS